MSDALHPDGPRFGEGMVLPIKPDPRLRPPVMIESKNPLQNQPEYTRFARGKVRGKLLESIQDNGFPKTPNVTSVEDLFTQAKASVSEQWKNYVLHEYTESGLQDGVLTRECTKWLQDIPDTAENKELRKILSDPQKLESMLSIRQMSALESLKDLNPNAWKTLLLASSERQLAELVVARHWINELPPAAFKRLGISKAELNIYVDIAGNLGKFFDEAYIKHLEMAELPGGTEKSKLAAAEEDDQEFLWDVHQPGTDRVKNLALVDVFPYEMGRIADRLNALSNRIVVQDNNIPQSYGKLSDYLRKMADVYGSHENTFFKVRDMWDELYKQAGNFFQSDCPIVITVMGATSVNDKVDPEIRFGLRTPETKQYQAQCDSFRKTTQKIQNTFKGATTEEHPIPPSSLSFQTHAFGPNLGTTTAAEADDESIVGHVNTILEVANQREIPLIKKVFPDLTFKESKYYKHATLENVLHELGHSVLSNDDKEILKRVGLSDESKILDELKAETVGMKILQAQIKEGLISSQEATDHFTASIGELLGYIAHKSSAVGNDKEGYFVAGVTMFKRLMDKGLMRKIDGGYEIANKLGSIEELAKMGDEILEMYSNTSTTPEFVAAYVDNLRTQKDDPSMKEFINIVKN